MKACPDTCPICHAARLPQSDGDKAMNNYQFKCGTEWLNGTLNQWNACKDSQIAVLKSERGQWIENCQVLADLASIPEQNCSCHLSPPCSDCVEYSRAREIIAELADLETSAASPEAQ